MNYINRLLQKLKSLANAHPHTKSLKLRWLWRIYFRNVSRHVSGYGNIFRFQSGLLWKLKISVSGNNNVISFSEGAIVKNLKVYVSGDNNQVHIDHNVIIKSGLIWIEGSGNNLRIGAATTIEQAEFHLTELNCDVLVGSDCMLSSGIIFRNGDSHSIYDRTTQRRLNQAGSIYLGDHIWVGHDVLFLKNSSVASGSIVGARSLVCKKFGDDFCVIAGTPAVVVKRNIMWSRERE